MELVRKTCSVTGGSRRRRGAEEPPERAASGAVSRHSPCYRRSKHCIRQLSTEGETEGARPRTFPLLFLGTGLPTNYYTLYCSRSGHKIHLMEGKESCIYFSGRKCLAHSARVFTERRMNLWGLTHTSSERGFWGKL